MCASFPSSQYCTYVIHRMCIHNMCKLECCKIRPQYVDGYNKFLRMSNIDSEEPQYWQAEQWGKHRWVVHFRLMWSSYSKVRKMNPIPSPTTSEQVPSPPRYFFIPQSGTPSCNCSRRQWPPTSSASFPLCSPTTELCSAGELRYISSWPSQNSDAQSAGGAGIDEAGRTMPTGWCRGQLSLTPRVARATGASGIRCRTVGHITTPRTGGLTW